MLKSRAEKRLLVNMPIGAILVPCSTPLSSFGAWPNCHANSGLLIVIFPFLLLKLFAVKITNCIYCYRARKKVALFYLFQCPLHDHFAPKCQ